MRMIGIRPKSINPAACYEAKYRQCNNLCDSLIHYDSIKFAHFSLPRLGSLFSFVAEVAIEITDNFCNKCVDSRLNILFR